jgi:hypothetical protein
VRSDAVLTPQDSPTRSEEEVEPPS